MWQPDNSTPGGPHTIEYPSATPGVTQGVDKVGVQFEEIAVQVDDAEHVGRQ